MAWYVSLGKSLLSLEFLQFLRNLRGFLKNFEDIVSICTQYSRIVRGKSAVKNNSARGLKAGCGFAVVYLKCLHVPSGLNFGQQFRRRRGGGGTPTAR